jgi:hypothetical protein
MPASLVSHGYDLNRDQKHQSNKYRSANKHRRLSMGATARGIDPAGPL